MEQAIRIGEMKLRAFIISTPHSVEANICVDCTIHVYVSVIYLESFFATLQIAATNSLVDAGFVRTSSRRLDSESGMSRPLTNTIFMFGLIILTLFARSIPLIFGILSSRISTSVSSARSMIWLATSPSYAVWDRVKPFRGKIVA